MNVRIHPYQGSDVYCEHCQLPPENVRHQDPDDLTITLRDLRRWADEWTYLVSWGPQTQVEWIMSRAQGYITDEWVSGLEIALADQVPGAAKSTVVRAMIADGTFHEAYREYFTKIMPSTDPASILGRYEADERYNDLLRVREPDPDRALGPYNITDEITDERKED